jgi:hypothetical protein
MSKMFSHFKIMIAPIAALVASAVMLLVTGLATPAKAEIVQFWEDVAKPNLTGHNHARKSASPNSHKRVRSADRDDESDRRTRKSKRLVRVASLGKDVYEPRPTRKSLSGGGVTWVASAGCLNSTLKSLVLEVAASYGSVTVSSTCRDRGHNAAVGGAKRSQHLTGDAVDFCVHGNVAGAIAFLNHNGSVGGFHNYGGGLLHIDTGDRRRW